MAFCCGEMRKRGVCVCVRACVWWGGARARL